MKTLSIHPYYAFDIFDGQKTVENRSWTTNYRGDILICSTIKKYLGPIPSTAMCVAELVDVTPMKRKHLEATLMDSSQYNPNSYAWVFDNVRWIKPFHVKGKLSLWECDEEIEFLKVGKRKKARDKAFEQYFELLMYNGEREEW